MSSLRARAQDLRNSIVNVVQHSLMTSWAHSRAASSKGLLKSAPVFIAWDGQYARSWTAPGRCERLERTDLVPA